MDAWTTTTEVDALVKGSPSTELLQEFADNATSILHAMSGMKFAGEDTITVGFEIDRRGYVKLTPWQPVNDVSDATIDGDTVEFAISPAGTYVTFDRSLAGKTVLLTLDVGLEPPVMATRAAAALAADMLRGDPRYLSTGTAGADPGDSRPASRLLSIARQGVTYTYADPATLAEKNLTGIQQVDLFLRAVNPNGARHQSKVVKV